MGAATIEVEIARVENGAVRLDRLVVPAATTLAQVLELACSAGRLRSDELSDLSVAVFGQRRAPEEPLHAGDRIELLGPLRADPKVARQRRVAHRRATDGRDKWRAG